MALVIQKAGIEDRARILALFERAFGAPADAADFAWKYDSNPCSAASVVALDGERAIGFYGALATRYRSRGEERPGLSAVDVMTDPESRVLGRRTLFTELGQTYCGLNAAEGAPFYFGFPHERARVVGERLLGYRPVERVGQFVKPLVTAGTASTVVKRRLRGLRRMRLAERFGRAHEALSEAVHARPGWRTDRSARVLNWRFHERRGVSYRTYQLYGLTGASRAYCVVRLVSERALLVDLQAVDESDGALPDLLDRVSEDLASTPARTLEMRAPQNGLLATRLRDELGFAAGTGDCYLEVRLLDDAFDLTAAAPLFDYRFSDHDIF